MTTNGQHPRTTDDTGGKRPALPLIAMSIVALTFAFAVVLAVGADWTDNDTLSATEGLPDLQQQLAAHEWLLDPGDSSLTVEDANPVTLVFGEDHVSGIGPCNNYRGRLSVDDDDDTVEITELAQTAQACEETTMRAEDEYFATLQEVRDVDLPDSYDQDRLVLSNDAGARLSYDAINADALIVGTWQVVNVAREDALQSVVEGTEPTLVFDADGDVALDTGCNQVRGSFGLDGDRLFVDDLAQTLQECDEPAGVMDQEAALVRALDTGEQVTVVPGRLTILDGDGSIALVAVNQATTN